MVNKTAREILESAKYLAGVRNSNMADFFHVVNVLNNIYKDVYRKIVANNSLYLKEYPIDSNEWEIPANVFTITDVYIKNQDTIIPIPRDSYTPRLATSYYLQDNKLILRGVTLGSVYARCSLLPETITCPNDPVEAIEYVTETNGYLINYDYYFNREDKQYVWDIRNNVVEETETPPRLKYSDTFGGQPVVAYPDKGWIIINDRDSTASFLVEDDVRIVAAVFSDPYAMVSYDNGHTYLFKYKNDEVQWTRWNPDSYTGHETLARVIALHTNDMTGDGVVYLDLVDNKLKFGSFVPDTVISSPSNILFTFLETKLAAYLISITGNSNEYLTSELLPSAEQELYDSMSTDQCSPVLMKNVNVVSRLNY